MRGCTLLPFILLFSACIYGHPVTGLLPDSEDGSDDPVVVLALAAAGLTTGGNVVGDTTPAVTGPVVASTMPADASTGQRLLGSISVTFGEAVDPATVTTNTTDTNCSGTFQVSADAFATCVTMFASPSTSDNTTFNTRPSIALTEGTTYTLRIADGVTTGDGQSVTSSSVKFRAFTPLEDVGSGSMRLWVKADAGVSTFGSDVSQWDDQSGRGNHFLPVSAGTEPTFTAVGIGGKPVVTFGGSDEMESPFNESDFDAAVFSLFAVAASFNTGAIFGKSDLAGSTTFRRKLELHANSYRAGDNADSFSLTGGIVGPDQMMAVIGRGNSDHTYSVNNVTLTTATTVADSDFNNGLARIGGLETSERLSGNIAEILFYNSPLSDAERVEVECYLSDKYRLALTNC